MSGLESITHIEKQVHLPPFPVSLVIHIPRIVEYDYTDCCKLEYRCLQS